MTNPDHELLKDLLLELEETPEPLRATELARLLAAHPSVAPELSAYAAALGSADTRLLGPSGDAVPPCVGGYRIIRLLGEGGMGSVYLAQEPPPLEREVAIKFIRPGFATPGMVQRFHFERDTLKSLDHPNIARVLDAGQGEDGLPFVVMEYVDGVPILDFCARHKLDLVARLGLIERVCEAVGDAHLKGFVHRDIKPGNVLIAGTPEKTVVKLIDFGVATAVDAGMRDHPETAAGFPIGTLEYMSPEQATGDRRRVDQRSDIYSLGVLLYETCTGALPRERSALSEHAGTDLYAYLDRIAIRSPSDLLESGAPNLLEVRGLLRRRLRELDWIILKALSTDPRDRYRSASQVAEDIRSLLADLPVSAAPPSRLYRLKKQVRRRPAVTTAVLVGVCAGLVLFVVVLGFTARLVAGLRDTRRALENEQMALAESEAAVDFLVGMIDAAGPGQSPSDVTVSEMLGAAAGSVSVELEQTPAVRWRIATLIGNSLATRRDMQRAQELIELGLADAVREFGEDSPQHGRSLYVLARIVAMRGDETEAIPVLARAIDLFDAGGEQWLLDRLRAMSMLAAIRARAGDAAASLDMQREVVELWDRLLPGDPLSLQPRLGLVLQLVSMSEYEEAARVLDAARADAAPFIESDFSAYSLLLETEQQLAFSSGDYPAGRETSRKLVNVYAAWYGHRDERTFLSRLKALIFAPDEDVDWDPVIEELEEIASLADAALTPPNRISARARHELGQSLRQAGRLEEATVALEDALAQTIALRNPKHPNIAAARAALATVLLDQGRTDEARFHAERARDLLLETNPASMNLPAIERLLQRIGSAEQQQRSRSERAVG